MEPKLTRKQWQLIREILHGALRAVIRQNDAELTEQIGEILRILDAR